MKRVVVTGLGFITSIGNDEAQVLQSLRECRTGVELFPEFASPDIPVKLAGTVKGFALPFLRRGIRVTSSCVANARPVAEFTLAQVLLANKGYFHNVQDYRRFREKSERVHIGKGNLEMTVALLGLGKIGRRVLDLLVPFDLNIIAYEPFMSAEALGIAFVVIVVGGLEHSVLSPVVIGAVGRLHLEQMPVLSGITAILSNIVSNVPAVLLLKPFIAPLQCQQQAWLTVAMASTLAGNFTLVGSVANLIVVQRARAQNVEIGFWEYFKVGAPLTVLTISVGVLWLEFG